MVAMRVAHTRLKLESLSMSHLNLGILYSTSTAAVPIDERLSRWGAANIVCPYFRALNRSASKMISYSNRHSAS